MEGKNRKQSSVTTSYVMMPEDANPAGNVHGGIIMKHIDTTAGMVAFRHARKNSVTASIDSLVFHYPVYIGNLLRLKASVNLTGRTSMEIGVRVEAENLLTGEMRHTASAYLTFVSLDEQGKPCDIPPLIIETGDEERRNREAKERRRIRLAQNSKEKP